MTATPDKAAHHATRHFHGHTDPTFNERRETALQGATYTTMGTIFAALCGALAYVFDDPLFAVVMVPPFLLCLAVTIWGGAHMVRAINMRPNEHPALNPTPAYTWDAQGKQLILRAARDTGEAPMLHVTLWPLANKEEPPVSVDIASDREVVVTCRAWMTVNGWGDRIVHAVNELTAVTRDYTRFPGSMPVVGVDRDAYEPLDFKVDGDTAVVNGTTVNLAGRPGEARLISAVASVWLQRRLAQDAAVYNADVQAEKARAEEDRKAVDRDALHHLLPASQAAALEQERQDAAHWDATTVPTLHPRQEA